MRFDRSATFAAVVSAFFGIGAAEPQQIFKSEGRLDPPLRFNRIDLEDGLPALGVYSIAQDARGFMWFGTQGGLARYDGRSMKTFTHDPADPDSLADSNVTALAADPSGDMWIGTSAGLHRLEARTQHFQRFLHDPDNEDSISADGIQALFLDEHGTLWIGTAAGLDRRDDDGTIRAISALKNTGITAIRPSSDGMLYIGTNTDGVVKYDPKADKVVAQYLSDDREPNSLSGDQVNALWEDRNGILWIGTQGAGLNALDLKTQRFKHYRHDPNDPESIPDDRILVLLEDTGGNLWIGTQGADLLRFDRRTERFDRYKSDQMVRERLAYQWVVSGYVDRGGVVWIGTMGGGISTFDPLKLELAPYRTGSATPSCFIEDARGLLWIATTPSQQGSGLYKLDRATRRYVHYTRMGDAEIDRYWITACIRDKRGRIWIGGEGFGVLRLDPESEAFRYFPLTDVAEDAKRVYALAEAGGRIWIGTWGAGLLAYNPKRDKFEIFKSDPEDSHLISSDHIYRVQPDRKDPDVLWIGTANGGLSKFSIKDGTATNYRHSPDSRSTLSNDNVTSILQLGDVLWLGTYGGGLNRFDVNTGDVVRIGKDQGIDAETIYGVLADKEGRLWLSTNGDGLYMFDPAKSTAINYRSNDGLQSLEFAQGSYYRDSKGIFYFGGPRGFNAFDPSRISPDGYPPPIAITELEIPERDDLSSRPAWATPSIEMSYSDAYLKIEFAALAFGDPTRNRYLYRLNGVHDDWITVPQSQGSATYTNLDDGNYTFEVKAIGRHGASSDTTATLAVRVTPAPWETWWAYVIYGLILLGIVGLYVRYQEQRVKALEQLNRLNAVERDLELTAAVQIGCLPETPIIREDQLTLFGVYSPAERCSGDWWWYEKSRNGNYWIVVGDVTGHGAGPAMVTAAVAAAFRVQGSSAKADPLARFDGVNREVISVARGKYHMVMSALEIDARTGRFVVYSAGGLPVFVLPHGAKQPKTYGSPGTPLGRDDFKLGEVEGKLNPGDRVLVLTDGLPEIEMPNGKLFGLRRVAQIYQSTANLPVEQACQKILEAAMNAKGPKPQSDDWTFVLAEWQPSGLR